jgi:hypothetical protein
LDERFGDGWLIRIYSLAVYFRPVAACLTSHRALATRRVDFVLNHLIIKYLYCLRMMFGGDTDHGKKI